MSTPVQQDQDFYKKLNKVTRPRADPDKAAQEQLSRIEEKIDKLHLVMSELLFLLKEDDVEEAELPAVTLDGAPAGAAREEGQSLG